MADFLECVASITWLLLAAILFHDLRKWNKRFQELYDEFKDAAPVVHGRWIPFHSASAGDIQYCSVCEIGNAAKSDFCPHCGAKMDGGGANG